MQRVSRNAIGVGRAICGPRFLSTGTTFNPANQHKKWSQEWLTAEAEYCTMRAYERHVQFMSNHESQGHNLEELVGRPARKEELEGLGKKVHYPAKTLGDKFALLLVKALDPLVHAFFRDRYNHHACVLETVAAVPGFVGATFRHMRSLRTMNRDHGWINVLLEESENERMHLLTWMFVTCPTKLERALVFVAQWVYVGLYAAMYLLSPRIAHRFVGYLEEKAVDAYTDYLNAIDKGDLPNGPAPEIAKRYWRLPEDATIRDVVLYVRADETLHRNANHLMGCQYADGFGNEHPAILSADELKRQLEVAKRAQPWPSEELNPEAKEENEGGKKKGEVPLE